MLSKGQEPFPKKAFLKIEGLTKLFGGLKALEEVEVSIEAGKVAGLIGPNGAGKTTLFNVVGGQVAPTRGCILLDGEDITALPPEARAMRGLARSFQIINCFPEAPALENVRLAL